VNKSIAQYYPSDIPAQPLIYHEAQALLRLQKYGIAPKLIDMQKDYLIMTYTGKPITKQSKLVNLSVRIAQMIAALSETSITHNDLRRDFRNYTELDGVLYLIDFQVSDIGNIRPGAAIRKGREYFYNNNEEDLRWFYDNTKN
jgi:tRNA A-37 threonylcarbamoyl transferase component Bud32